MDINTKEMLNEIISPDKNKNEDKNIMSSEQFYSRENKYKNIYSEKKLKDILKKDFNSTIISRGIEYYYNCNIENVYKDKNKYIAKVYGNSNPSYKVTITIDDDLTAHYECTCPCEYNCKHEYAVLVAISNLEYQEVSLKTSIEEKEYNLKSLVEQIPAEELKNYILSPVGMNKVSIELVSFKKYFRKYLPVQEYEFYYNNLYNAIVLNENYVDKINEYIENAKDYLQNSDFESVLKIVESIIEAYNDGKRLNLDSYVFDIINKLGMLLRITYRKSNDKIKNEIKEWTLNLKNNNYYNNLYLEDMILTLK